MTEQTTLATRTPYNRFRELVRSDNVQERFTQLLNKRKDEFLASLLSLVSADKSLLECDPVTIFAAAAKAAILRLPIAKELGFAFIVPFKHEAVFVLGYKGMIQLAIRTGQYRAINATEIYEGEEIIVDRLTGMVKLDGRRTGDQVTGYVSYFNLKNGFEKYLYMDRSVVQRHAERFSRAYQYGQRTGKKDSAWFTSFDDMGKKTVLRLLLGKYGLFSIEMQDSDTIDAPVIGNDPRLTVPNFGDLSTGALEGEARDVPELPQPEEPPQPPSNDPAWTEPPAQPEDVTHAATVEEPEHIDVRQTIVDAGLAENIHEAGNIVKKVRTPNLGPAQIVDWARVYRGWRDLGASPEQAAASANKGEMPH